MPTKQRRRGIRQPRRKTQKHRLKRRIPVWRKTSKQLTPKQRRIRRKSLEALSLVRREKLSLQEASQRVSLDPQTVINNTGAFRRVRSRLRVKKFDRIPRTMIIYEKGRRVTVEIANSRVASIIGEYHNAVKQFLETGKSSLLRPFAKTRFKDIRRRTHSLETRPKVIYRIKEREPRPEYFEIYKR